MATDLMPPPATIKPARYIEPTVSEIIAAARTAPVRSRGVWLLAGLSGPLMWASFPPLDFGPLGWLCLVPLMLLVRLPQRTQWMYRAVYLGGLAFTLPTLQWMRLGDTWMYPAWIALAVYFALYLPVFVAVSRVAVHRFRLPLMFAAPAVWVGLEYIRGLLMTGFSWYYLAHTQYRWVELIQISDLVGGYGVSFLLAMTSACIAGLLPMAWLQRLPAPLLQSDGRSSTGDASHAGEASKAGERSMLDRGVRRPGVSVGVCLAVVAAALIYGYVRRSQAEFREGPRVALVQGNFTASLKHNPGERADIYLRHEMLTGQAVVHQPDLIVWPETMFRWPLYDFSPETTDEQLLAAAPDIPPDYADQWVKNWRDPTVRRTLENSSQKAGAAMVIGIDTFEAGRNSTQHYNSALFVRPDTGISGRYDKLHRVPFGEYIPLKDEVPWIKQLTPFGDNFGLSAGSSAAIFSYGGWKFAPIICFEDTVPHLVRRILNSTAASNGGKPVDCLINLTNDGWFHGSSELDQHLITAAFRCVEYRTPMARAVNTGISAVIDGDGVIVEPDVFIDANQQGRTSMRDPRTGRFHRQLDAVLVDSIPLDNRTSLYLWWGDWFAGGCCFLAILVILLNFVPSSGSRLQAPRS